MAKLREHVIEVIDESYWKVKGFLLSKKINVYFYELILLLCISFLRYRFESTLDIDKCSILMINYMDFLE